MERAASRYRIIMPPFVDHDKMRVRVAGIAADIISEQGIDAVTAREIAKRTNFSTHIVSHYFKDKRDLLLFTWTLATQRAVERVSKAKLSGGSLLSVLEAMLPLDPVSRADWSVGLAFWSGATSDPELAKAQSHFIEQLAAILIDLLPDRPNVGLPTNADGDDRVGKIFATVLGVALLAMIDDPSWSRARLRMILKSALPEGV
jgi:AcrR family transcriptional regulator